MKIGLDFDGVFTDCGKHKMNLALKLFHQPIASEDFRKEIVLNNGWLSPDQYQQVQDAVYDSMEYGLDIPEVDKCFDYLKKLLFQGNEAVIVTSRHGLGLEVARTWLLRRGWNLPILNTPHPLPKTELVRGCDVYIDDDLDKLELMIGMVPNLFLMHWGYNSQDVVNGSIKRIYSWADFYEKVNLLNTL